MAGTLRIPFEHGTLPGPLRGMALGALAGRFPDECVDDALLVISELVQNVTQHTASRGVLDLSWDGDGITVRVHDGDLRAPRPQPPDERREGGRGLLLVGGLASSWGTETRDDGKTVWARVAAQVYARSA